MENPTARILKVIAFVMGFIGTMLGILFGAGYVFLIWGATFFECMFILGFAELIEQSTLHNQKLDELLERIGNKKSESETETETESKSEEEDILLEEGDQAAVVEPIYLHNGSIKCPLCETVQSSIRSHCWKCEAIFKKDSDI